MNKSTGYMRPVLLPEGRVAWVRAERLLKGGGE